MAIFHFDVSNSAQRYMRYITSWIVLAAVIFWGCRMVGARINTSSSIPLGLYWVSKETAGKGSYVVFCPPPSQLFDEAKKRRYIKAGFCPGNYGYMMKRVLAAQNDVVSIFDEGVRVNGKLLPFSRPLTFDRIKQPLPHYRLNNHVLAETELLLMSDVSSSSFDGRYFGLGKRSWIVDVVHPVFTW